MKTYIDYCPNAPVSINTELITVPSGPPYVVETEHNWIVDDSSIEIWENNDKSGTHLVEEAYDGSVSGSGKYQVDYLGASEGDAKYCNKIFFHADQGGLSFYVWYKTEGDVFGADDANSKALKDSDATEGNLAKFDSSGNPIDSGIASNTVPIKTTQNLTFYVNSATGSDENDGSSGSPFKTIAKAISLIPQIVNHDVAINLADGSYSEGITLSGYVGKGIISVKGNTTTPSNVVLSGQILLQGCHTRYTALSGLKTTYTASHAVYVTSCFSANLNKIVAIESASGAGVAYEYSIGTVQESTFSNRTYGIFCTSKSIIYSYNNDGESNTYGLYCNQAATIGKGVTQPSGTTGEYATLGGVIR